MSAFDAVVIGAGMIGSSCAKYLSKFGLKVLLIGPDEDSRDLAHGAWFDQGRNTTVVTGAPYWRELGKACIAQ